MRFVASDLLPALVQPHARGVITRHFSYEFGSLWGQLPLQLLLRSCHVLYQLTHTRLCCNLSMQWLYSVFLWVVRSACHLTVRRERR